MEYQASTSGSFHELKPVSLVKSILVGPRSIKVISVVLSLDLAIPSLTETVDASTFVFLDHLYGTEGGLRT